MRAKPVTFTDARDIETAKELMDAIARANNGPDAARAIMHVIRDCRSAAICEGRREGARAAVEYVRDQARRLLLEELVRGWLETTLERAADFGESAEMKRLRAAETQRDEILGRLRDEPRLWWALMEWAAVDSPYWDEDPEARGRTVRRALGWEEGGPAP